MIERIVKTERKLHLVFAIIIGAGVVSFWRGVWNLLDLYLFPTNLIVSNFVSVFLGLYIIIFLGELTRKLI
jgi:hypothetical protein